MKFADNMENYVVCLIYYISTFWCGDLRVKKVLMIIA